MTSEASSAQPVVGQVLDSASDKDDVRICVTNGPSALGLEHRIFVTPEEMARAHESSTFTLQLPTPGGEVKLLNLNVVVVAVHRLDSEHLDMKGYIPINELNRGFNPRFRPYLSFEKYELRTRSGAVVMQRRILNYLLFTQGLRKTK